MASALTARGEALALNLAVLGQPLLYYLVPCAAYGVWRLKRERAHWPAFAYLVSLYLAMSLVFPFQSARGGTFHSLAALLPFLAIWTVTGLEGAVSVAARRRRWIETQAQWVFAVTLIAMSALSSVYFLVLQTGRWNAQLATYRDAGRIVDALTAPGVAVVVADPPGFWYASGRPAIVIPSDGFDALLAAAGQFGAGYVVVQESGPRYLAPLWSGGEPVPGFTCAGTTPGAAVYTVDPTRAAPASVCPRSPAP